MRLRHFLAALRKWQWDYGDLLRTDDDRCPLEAVLGLPAHSEVLEMHAAGIGIPYGSAIILAADNRRSDEHAPANLKALREAMIGAIR